MQFNKCDYTHGNHLDAIANKVFCTNDPSIALMHWLTLGNTNNYKPKQETHCLKQIPLCEADLNIVEQRKETYKPIRYIFDLLQIPCGPTLT